MKYILLPTDFSDNARNAMVYAVQLFGFKEVQYILLNTFIEPHMAAGSLVSMKDELQKRSTEGLTNDMEFLKERFKDQELSIQRRSGYGDLAYLINKAAKDEFFDFVVMGTKGETAGRWLMGSVAKSTIQTVTVPVIVVPEDAKYKKVSNIVYATDLNEDESYLIGTLAEFAEISDATITILHVSPDESTKKWDNEAMKEAVSKVDYEKMNFVDLIHPDVDEAITNYTQENDTDILAMTTYTTTLLKKMFHRSVTKQLLLHTQIPMLVFNRKEYNNVLLG